MVIEAAAAAEWLAEHHAWHKARLLCPFWRQTQEQLTLLEKALKEGAVHAVPAAP